MFARPFLECIVKASSFGAFPEIISETPRLIARYEVKYQATFYGRGEGE